MQNSSLINPSNGPCGCVEPLRHGGTKGVRAHIRTASGCERIATVASATRAAGPGCLLLFMGKTEGDRRHFFPRQFISNLYITCVCVFVGLHYFLHANETDLRFIFEFKRPAQLIVSFLCFYYRRRSQSENRMPRMYILGFGMARNTENVTRKRRCHPLCSLLVQYFSGIPTNESIDGG